MPFTPGTRPQRPHWLRAPAPTGEGYREVKTLVDRLGLHTVCQSAACPNLGDCWNQRTATFLLLGGICTRRCGFCAVTKGFPEPLDPGEPGRVADAVAALALRYAVLTSVTRDDLPDGGAGHFAAAIRAIRQRVPGCRVEVLIPDFRGSRQALQTVLAAAPDVLNHNLETVPRLYPRVRPGASYERSLALLAAAHELRPQRPAKSGLMLGIGESLDEVLAVMGDLRAAGVDLLTLGQYLRPSPLHLPVSRFVSPQEFERLASQGRKLGFAHVEAGPLVRSSYRAAAQTALSAGRSA
jgi:lipoic acid synthetase